MPKEAFSDETKAPHPPAVPVPGPVSGPLPRRPALTPEQAGDLLNVYYIDDVPEEVLEQSTISGMLEVLGDPYTQYFTPEEYALFSSSLSDTELVGIGISSLITGEGLLIQRYMRTRLPPLAASRRGI